MRRQVLVPVLVLFLLSLTAFACGGGDSGTESAAAPAATPPAATAPPSEAAPLPEICALLTSEEIEATLGEAAGAGALPETPGPPQCIWLHSDGVTTQVHLLVTPAPAPTLESYLDQARESLGENAETWTLESVDGLGQYAAVIGPPNFPVLQIVDRGLMLQVTTQEANGRSIVENAQLLAELALPRLFEAAPASAGSDSP